MDTKFERADFPFLFAIFPSRSRSRRRFIPCLTSSKDSFWSVCMFAQAFLNLFEVSQNLFVLRERSEKKNSH